MPAYHDKSQHADSGNVRLNIFAPYTDAQVQAIRMGTPAYQMVHPYNKAMSSGVKDAHYKSLVQPTMSKANKSISKHLGMNALAVGSKFNGLM
jgi:hypothetical protein